MAKFKVGDVVIIKNNGKTHIPTDWVGHIGTVIEISNWAFPYLIEWNNKQPFNADSAESFKEDELMHYNNTLIRQKLGIK